MKTLTVMARATVDYACFLNENDSFKVIKYAEENDCELEEAVMTLYCKGELDLYGDSNESDFSTESIESVEEKEEQ